MKKTSKKSTPKKTTASKKKAAYKKTSSTKTSSKKSTKSNSILSKAKAKAKSLYNKGKKALKKTTETIKEKAKRLKKTITCNVAKAGRAVVSAFIPEPVYAGEKDSGKTKNNKESKKNKAPKKTDLYQRMLLASQYNQYIRANSKELNNSSSVMETIHLILDVSGLVVDIADPINGVLYLLEGDYENAGLSFAATIPFVGSLGTTGRVAKTVKNYNKLNLSNSKIAEASKAAYKAIQKTDAFTISNKHLEGAGGRWRKFNTNSSKQVNTWIKEGLNSENMLLYPNNNGEGYIIVSELGKQIGTKGESKIKIVIGEDGEIWTAYPKK